MNVGAFIKKHSTQPKVEIYEVYKFRCENKWCTLGV